MPKLSNSQLLGLSFAVGLACIGRVRQIWTLLRRARWLLLLMVIMYGYSLPGEALYPVLAHYLPTREGILQGLVHAWRLALVVLLLDVLVLRLPIAEQLTGIHSILRPLAWVGLDRDRVVVRLALTMEAMQRPQDWAGMRQLLAGQAPAHEGPRSYVFAVRPYRGVDWALLVVLTLGVVWLYA